MKDPSQRARLVGGISSAGRALPPTDGESFRASRAKGPFVWDQHDRRFIDTVMGFGATMLGHTPEAVCAAVADAVDTAPMPGFGNLLEERAAEVLTRQTLNLDKVIFVNSGSEAVHRACQIARHVTGRPRIVKFAAAYDGWFDGSAFGRPGTAEAEMSTERRASEGAYTLLAFNDDADVDRLFGTHADIAAILAEPVLANAGCLLPRPGYLERLQEAAAKNGVLIIADEVLMGFRLRNGLASHQWGFRPDIATVGKAMGSGFAVAAVIGSSEVMRAAETAGFLRAGTYNGNPVACAAVIATARELERLDYPALLARGDHLRRQLEETGKRRGVTLSTSGFGTVFTLWFGDKPPRNYAEALRARNPARSLRLHHELRRNGALMMPDAFGRLFLSAAHSEAVLEELVAAFDRALQAL